MFAIRVKKLMVAACFGAAMGVTALGGMAALGHTAAVGGNAIILASNGGNVVTSPGTVDSDGTQGSYVPAVQGQADSDGDQDAYLNNSWEATPQDKPHTK
jgi:hypothetical protein